MEQSKIAVKSKKAKIIADKTADLKVTGNTDKSSYMDNYGLKLTLDNSLNKYASDPFFVKHAKAVNNKFVDKSNS